MKRIALISSIFISAILFSSSCYNPSLNDEPFLCGGSHGNPECPDGYQCYGGICRTSPPECWAKDYFGTGSGFDDVDLEPNNIPSLAWVLPCGDMNAGTQGSNCPNRYAPQNYTKLAICGENDIDFYKIYLYSGEVIDFTLKYDYAAFRDLSLSLWKETVNADGSVDRELIQTSASTNSDEKITYNVDSTGWYYFMVYGATSQDTSDYALMWQVSQASAE